jgi:hypothetical protein
MFHPDFRPRQCLKTEHHPPPDWEPTYDDFDEDLAVAIDNRIAAGDDPAHLSDVLHELIVAAINRTSADKVVDPFGVYGRLLEQPEWELDGLHCDFLTDAGYI